MYGTWLIYYSGRGWYGCRVRQHNDNYQGVMIWRKLDGFTENDSALHVWTRSKCEVVGYIGGDDYPRFELVYP